MADDDELSAEELKAKGNRASEVYGMVAAILKEENQGVIGTVLGSLLAGFGYAHFGWGGTCAVGGVFSLATIVPALTWRTPASTPTSR